MTDWRQGGPFGSINRLAKREVRNMLAANATAVRVRPGYINRVARRCLGTVTFAKLVLLYFLVNCLLALAEVWISYASPHAIPAWTSVGIPQGTDLKAVILNVSSYLLGTQVGLLGVISLALALVTLIAQREDSSTDVQVYYHESFSFEIVASCVALAAVLSIQLVWPLQFVLHRLGLGTSYQAFKITLLAVHMGWLLVNLGAVAYFISITFRFVHQSERETLRERFTAHVLYPDDLKRRVREHLYMLAGREAVDSGLSGKPAVTFGFDYGAPYEVEIEGDFTTPKQLSDIRVTLAHWVARRWAARCAAKPAAGAMSFGRGPLLWLHLNLDTPLRGRVAWCRRRGGVPLTGLEKFVLKQAFCFKRVQP